MKNKFPKSNSVVLFLSTIVCMILFFASCKENTILPPDLVPDVDNVNTFQTDTFSVISSTIYQDSLLTGGLLGSTSRSADPAFYHAIGAITNDPVFGKTVASSYFQVVQPSPSFYFLGTGQIIDSVVVSIPYVNSFGDTLSSTPQVFSLYRTKDNLSKDSAYYESSSVNYSASDLWATSAVDFSTISTDSQTVNGIKIGPRLSFKLPSSFHDSLLAQTSSGAYLNFTTFREWLGGFYIAPDSTAGNTLGYFDTYNGQMKVYYRYTNSSNLADTTETLFKFSPSACNRFNRITRSYNGKPANNFINTTNPVGDSLVFIQGEPGLATQVSFPTLGQFPNAIINKAELSFTVVSPYTNFTDTNFYNAPSRIQITFVNEDGEDEVLEDYIVLNTNWVGGFKKSYTLNGLTYTQYKFNITHSIQKAISTKNTNFKLKMTGVRSTFPALHRVVVRGGSSQNVAEKMKLNIIFTKIQ